MNKTRHPEEFYDNGTGDKLIDPSHYPQAIQSFLRVELEMLTALRTTFDTLIEVGCMRARFLDWAIANSKQYLGIDVVPRYIELGKKEIIKRNRTFSPQVGHLR